MSRSLTELNRVDLGGNTVALSQGVWILGLKCPPNILILEKGWMTLR